MRPPRGGLFNFKLSSWPHPRKFGLKRFLTVRKVLAGRWGSLFLGYLLGKHIGGEIAPISFRLTWDGCSSLLPFGGVLSFQSEAREVLSSETAGVHHADRWRGGRVAVRGVGAAAGDAGGRIPALRLRNAPCARLGCIPPGPERIRLRRGPERGDRTKMGRQ